MNIYICLSIYLYESPSKYGVLGGMYVCTFSLHKQYSATYLTLFFLFFSVNIVFFKKIVHVS